MDDKILRDGQFVLFLDLLGFRDIVQTQPPWKVYKLINTALNACNAIRLLDSSLGMVHFSDSFVIYGSTAGYDDYFLKRLIVLTGSVTTGLLARNMPVRGSIAFGDLTVHKDYNGMFDVFFGKALLEALDAEKRDDWIGVTICPSAWKPASDKDPPWLPKMQEQRRLIVREDGMVALNPVPNLICQFWQKQDRNYRGELVSDIQAYRFLKKESEVDDRDKRVTSKYRATMDFLHTILPPECLQWAESSSDGNERGRKKQ